MYMYFNLVKCGFIFLAASVLVGGLMVNFCESRLPAAIVQAFRFGKFSYVGKKTFVSHLEVPKRWFKHFYVIATLYSIFMLYLIVNTYVLSKPVCSVVLTLLDLVGSSYRSTKVNATTVCLAMALFCIQVWKRFYETFVISVFSDTKINISHYIIGICHYLGSFTAIILEAPGFARLSHKYRYTLSVDDIGITGIVGSIIFLWACYNQYRSAVVLANLRKDEKGQIVCYEHKIPEGGLFKRLSSPHMFCEMLMYLALLIVLWGNTTWPFVFIWVLCNQCENALLNHWWYQTNFKDYPTERKAFLPFIL